ncbi:diguanylate cyclase domain-containing protein [Burkholderiaceae bacterium UC74_6]
MNAAAKRLAFAVALAAAALAGTAQAAGGFDPALEKRLDEIARQALRDPDGAQKELEQQQLPQALMPRASFTAVRIAIEAGDTAQAAALTDQLAANASQQAAAFALRALAAQRQSRLAEAAVHARKSLELIDADCRFDATDAASQKNLPQRCDLSSALIDLAVLHAEQFASGAIPRAAELAKRHLALAEIAERPADAVEALLEMLKVDLASDRAAEGNEWVRRMRREAGEDAMLLAQAKTGEAMLASALGDKPAQLRALQDSQALARQSGVPGQLTRANINLADYYMHERQPERAVTLLTEALSITQRLHDQVRERTVHHNMAVALIRLKQFAAARKEMARADELRFGAQDTKRVQELRELDDAWTEAGQPREAIALFHEERSITAETNARNRAALLAELQVKTNAAARQRDLDLLQRDQSLKVRQISNQRLLGEIGVALAVLLALASVLGLAMLRKARAANKALKAREALLRSQSERDPLTDLANRRHFFEVMQTHAAERPEGFTGALLMVDIDHFKHVNDEHGHAAGDAVICEVARRLSGAVRTGDLVVRWGGEEFIVFAPVATHEQVQALAARVLESVGHTPIATPDGALRITASIGFAHFPFFDAAQTDKLRLHWERAVNWVDMALYTAKARGRNCAIGIQAVHAKSNEELGRIEKDFDAACSSGKVELGVVQGPTTG